jgi:hypothetical protein
MTAGFIAFPFEVVDAGNSSEQSSVADLKFLLFHNHGDDAVELLGAALVKAA